MLLQCRPLRGLRGMIVSLFFLMGLTPHAIAMSPAPRVGGDDRDFLMGLTPHAIAISPALRAAKILKVAQSFAVFGQQP